jgi:succinyl-diaminopimelate desuccinylase
MLSKDSKKMENDSPVIQDVYKEIDKYQERMVADISRLVRCKSVAETPKPGMPFGEGPYKALQMALEISRELGLKTVDLDGYVGYAEYGEGEEYVAVPVHLDVVPEGTGWSVDPYEGVIKDGKLYGRGSSDNKGPSVAAIYALKVLKDLNVQTKRRVRVIFGTNEESGMACLDYYFQKEPLPLYGFSPDAEYPAYNREKGIMSVFLKKKTEELTRFTPIVSITAGSAINVVPESCTVTLKETWNDSLEILKDISEGKPGNVYFINEKPGKVIAARGTPAHGSRPEEGLNAVAVMLQYLFEKLPSLNECEFLQYIKENIGYETDGTSLGIAMEDGLSGKLTNNLGLFRMTEKEASAGLNIRYPVTCKGEDVLKGLKASARVKNIDVVMESDSPPLYVPEDHPLIQKLMTAYETVTGEKGELRSMGGGTYARKLQNRGIAFGGTGHNVHQADEHIVIEELMRHARICTQAIYELVI